MSDRINMVTCTACGLEYSKGEKRCPLCGVRNKNIDLISLLTKKKTDDTYDRYASDKEKGYTEDTEMKISLKLPAKKNGTSQKNTKTNRTAGKRKQQSSALSLIIKFILIVLAMLIFN